MPSDVTYKLVRELPRKDILLCMARMPFSQKLFAGSSDGNIYEFDAAQAKPGFIPMRGHSGYVTGMALGGCGNRVLLSGGSDGRLIWWDTQTREATRVIIAHEKWIRAIKASPDGRLIASVGDDMACRIWRADTYELVHTLRGHELFTPQNLRSMLYTCAFSPDGTLLATADRIGHIVVWDVATGKATGSIETPLLYTWDGKQRLHSIGGVRSLAFSPDGSQLAAGGIGQIGNIDGLGAKARVEVHDWRNKKLLAEIVPEKQGLVEVLHYHPGGDWLLLAGGGAKGFIIFVDPKDRKILMDEATPMSIHDVSMTEDHKRILAVGHLNFVTYAINS